MSPLRQHRVKSCGPGGLVVLAATNYITNPRLVDGNDDGVADLWTLNAAALAGTLIKTVTLNPLTGRYQQRFAYTGVAGDVNRGLNLTFFSAAGAFAQNDPASIGLRVISCDVVGCTARADLQAATAADGYLGGGGTSTSNFPNGTRDARFTKSTVFTDATASKAKVLIRIDGIDEGDTFDLTVSEPIVVKAAAIVPYFDGTYPDCKFSGAVNASTSLRYRVQT